MAFTGTAQPHTNYTMTATINGKLSGTVSQDFEVVFPRWPAPACPPMMTMPGRPRIADVYAPQVDGVLLDVPPMACAPQLNGFGQSLWNNRKVGESTNQFSTHIDHNFSYAFSAVQIPSGSDGTGAAGISLSVRYLHEDLPAQPHNPQTPHVKANKKKHLTKTGVSVSSVISAACALALVGAALANYRRYKTSSKE